MFGTTARDAFEPSTVRRRALAAWATAGLGPIGLYEARHTCASLLSTSGADAKVIQTVMGHATISMTFDTYEHLMPGGLSDAARLANVYLAGQGGTVAS